MTSQENTNNIQKQSIESKAEVTELLNLISAITSNNIEEFKSILNSKKLLPQSLNKLILKGFQEYKNKNTSEIKEMILLLLKQNQADIDILLSSTKQKKEKATGLLIAGMRADIEFITELLIFKPNVNFLDYYSKNILMYLIMNFKGEETTELVDCVKLLLNSGIHVNAEDNQGNTSLTIAVDRGFIEVCSLLLNSNANINQQVKGNFNNTPLHLAVKNKNIQLIKLFLKYNPNTSLKNELNKNIIEEAIESNSSEIYTIIVEFHNKRKEHLTNHIQTNQNSKNNNYNNNAVDNSNEKNEKYFNENIVPFSYNRDNKIVLNSSPSVFASIKNENYLMNKISNLPKKDAKYFRIKNLIEESKLDIPNIKHNIEKTEENILRKYEAQIIELKKNNTLLKLENQLLISELRVKDALLIEHKIIDVNCDSELNDSDKTQASTNKKEKTSMTNNNCVTEGTNNNSNIYANHTDIVDDSSCNNYNTNNKYNNNNITTMSTTTNANSNINMTNTNQSVINEIPNTSNNNNSIPPTTINSSMISNHLNNNFNNMNMPNFNHIHSMYPNFHSFNKPYSQMPPRREMLEKKFSTNMYNNEYVLKSLHRDLLDFQEYNREQIRKIKPVQEELLQFIRDAVAETLPDYEVRLYGSHATGLCLSWSDLDTVLVHKKGMSQISFSPGLHPLYVKLLDKPWKKSIKFIETAVIPLIKIIASDKYNNMQIDISVQDSKHYGLKCVELVKSYMIEFEALEPLLYSLKNLLKNANLNDPYTGGISSYGLILMLVSFLQNQNEHGKNISVKKDSNVGRLFLEFCYYYGVVFDHNKYVINAYPLNGSDNYQDKESMSFLYVRIFFNINMKILNT